MEALRRLGLGLGLGLEGAMEALRRWGQLYARMHMHACTCTHAHIHAHAHMQVGRAAVCLQGGLCLPSHSHREDGGGRRSVWRPSAARCCDSSTQSDTYKSWTQRIGRCHPSAPWRCGTHFPCGVSPMLPGPLHAARTYTNQQCCLSQECLAFKGALLKQDACLHASASWMGRVDALSRRALILKPRETVAAVAIRHDRCQRIERGGGLLTEYRRQLHALRTHTLFVVC